MDLKYGIKSTKVNAVAVGMRKGGDYFAMPSDVEVTQDSVRKFIEDVNAGLIAKTVGPNPTSPVYPHLFTLIIV
jgi:hypothetical protein